MPQKLDVTSGKGGGRGRKGRRIRRNQRSSIFKLVRYREAYSTRVLLFRVRMNYLSSRKMTFPRGICPSRFSIPLQTRYGLRSRVLFYLADKCSTKKQKRARGRNNFENPVNSSVYKIPSRYIRNTYEEIVHERSRISK